MGTPFDKIKEAILGNPLDPNKRPSRTGIVQAFSEFQSQIEGTKSGAIIRSTYASLVAMTTAPYASCMAWVTNDPTGSINGIYENTGTASSPVWIRRTSLPQLMVTGINTGVGTANAIQVTTDVPFPAENGKCLLAVPIVATNNTQNVTLSINGSTPISIVRNDGTSVGSGALQSGKIHIGIVYNAQFRLIADPPLQTDFYKNRASHGFYLGRPIKEIIEDTEHKISEIRTSQDLTTHTGNVTSFVSTPDENIIHIQLFGGQSLQEGMMDPAFPYETTIVANSPIYPDNAFMLSSGVRLRLRNGVEDLSAPLHGTDSGITSLIEAADAANNTYETAASGCVNTLIRDVETATGRKIKVVALVAARAAWSIEQLSRGQPAYNWMMRGLRDIVDSSKFLGLKPVVISLDWCQTETDNALETSPVKYANSFSKLIRNLKNDVMAITNQNDEMIVTLTPSQFISMNGYNNICVAHDIITTADSSVIPISPTYSLPRSTGQQIHLTSIGQNRRGVAMSKAILHGYFGSGFAPMVVESVFQSGTNKITVVWSDVPFIDTSGDDINVSGLPSGNVAGLALYDLTTNAQLAISSVAVSNRNMTLTLASNLTNAAKLTYAQQSNDMSLTNFGPVNGARGWIRRAASGTISPYESGRVVHDWAIPFTKQVHR